MSAFWIGRKVAVTGGAGFIGSWVVEALRAKGLHGTAISIPRSADCDLRLLENCRRAIEGCSIVIHLAASTGGIAFSRAHPASQFRDCTLIDVNMFEAARLARVDRFVSLGNLLAYPEAAPTPLREESLHDGPIAASHLGIGAAKRNLVGLATMYHREHGLHAVNVLSANAYGPRDRFDAERAHVIPATIRKCFSHGDLVVWGDGTPTRDFLYASDIAEGILLAAERLEAAQFANLGSGSEVSIGDLVERIARLCNFEGTVLFDTSRPSGDPRRVASSARSRELLGFEPRVPLDEGLARTIDWYRKALRAAPP